MPSSGAAELALRLAVDATPVTVAQTASTLDRLFSSIRPNLNYVRPDTRALSTLTRVELAGLPGDAAATLIEQLGLEVQVAVDDAAVLAWLRAADALAGVLEHSSDLDSTQREQMRRLRIFIGVALLRQKRATPTWKSVEEFAEVAEALVGNENLHGRVQADCRELLDQGLQGEQRDRVLKVQQSLAGLGDDQHRVAALNRLIKPFIAAPATAKLLRSALQPRASGTSQASASGR